MKISITSTLVGVSMAALGAAAVAQTNSTASPNAKPAPVAVSPQTAVEANEKAVKRSDVATVVRTSPTAAEKARQLQPMNGTATTGGERATGVDTATTSTLPARADRN